ncbi:hypothetical protein CDCA_CDCA11G3154 [Cyanidium caldarium]|uniref:Uncharacterized protein n=1 Tax=Cyanidium caldarium TaxID=2771 RepID=A0AAV9IXW4_CYACA|nr:hypothetical protein CDCA_CDCA11G3154 [Cyanidium caldarium]|eukprot:ctg_955.g367
MSRRLPGAGWRVALLFMFLSAFCTAYFVVLHVQFLVPQVWPQAANGVQAREFGATGSAASMWWRSRTRRRARCKPSSTEWSAECIPFLCTALEFEASNYTERLLSSIRHPVAHVVVVVGGKDMLTLKRAQAWTRRYPDVHFVRVPDRIGCAGGWNICIKYMLDVFGVDWGIVANNDISFPVGSLKQTAAAFLEARQRQPGLCLGRIEMDTRPGHGSYSAFVVTREFRDACGLFDENLFPAYLEDFEMDIRAQRLRGDGCVAGNIFSAERFHHGPEGAVVYVSGVQDMVNRDEERSGEARARIGEVLQRGHRSGFQYMADKWGCSVSQQWDACTFQRPFNRTHLTPRDWVYDPAYRRCVLTGTGLQGDHCPYDVSVLAAGNSTGEHVSEV